MAYEPNYTVDYKILQCLEKLPDTYPYYVPLSMTWLLITLLSMCDVHSALNPTSTI